MKLFDSELRVMEVLWQEGPIPARQVAEILGGKIGWNKNTTYTVIKKCVDKGAVAREEPDFICRPLVAREEVPAVVERAILLFQREGLPGERFGSTVERLGMARVEAELLGSPARG